MLSIGIYIYGDYMDVFRPKDSIMSQSALLLLLSTTLFVVCSASDKETRKSSYNDQDTLVLAHVIFRHGDRTPDPSSLYPNDPYINETYYPFGTGQLTLEGKRRAYKLGESLRQRYNVFLDQVYNPDIMEGLSSAYPRAQMTLQAVQSGLFPPVREYEIKEGLHWQPLPIQYNKFEDDNLIATFVSCEKMFDVADELEKKYEYRKALQDYADVFRYLTKHSGWVVNNTRLAFFIQNSLKTEEEWGFKLPEWTKPVWPDQLKNVASLFWKVMSSTKQLRGMAIGNLLKKILDDSIKKMFGQLRPVGRKLFLYSGHDFTVVPILAALGHYHGEHMPYTAHVIFELHHIDGIYGFKIYLQDYKQQHPRLLNVRNCGTFCHVHNLEEIIKEHVSLKKNSCS